MVSCVDKAYQSSFLDTNWILDGTFYYVYSIHTYGQDHYVFNLEYEIETPLSANALKWTQLLNFLFEAVGSEWFAYRSKQQYKSILGITIWTIETTSWTILNIGFVFKWFQIIWKWRLTLGIVYIQLLFVQIL